VRLGDTFIDITKRHGAMFETLWAANPQIANPIRSMPATRSETEELSTPSAPAGRHLESSARLQRSRKMTRVCLAEMTQAA
jgi:hypothetical protein